MFRVKSKDTGPEKIVRKILRKLRVGYRCNVKGMPGTPDIVMSKYQLVIFVNGCFWHQHSCPAATFPSTNHRFWSAKFDRTRIRDQKNIDDLTMAGWDVHVIWECETRAVRKLSFKVRGILETRKNFLHDGA